MSLVISRLNGAYNRAVDFKALRAALRIARRDRGWSLSTAGKEAGLDRATVHSIENVKREPDYKPELETIERLVLAYGKTLSQFFAELEGTPPVGASAPSLPVVANPAAILPVTSGDIERLGRILGETIGKSIREVGAMKPKKGSKPRRFRGSEASDHPPRKDHHRN